MEHAWTFIDILGYVAMLVTLVGTVFLMRPSRALMGWTMRMCGDLLWMYWSYLTGIPSALVNETLFLLIDTLGIYRTWNRTHPDGTHT